MALYLWKGFLSKKVFCYTNDIYRFGLRTGDFTQSHYFVANPLADCFATNTGFYCNWQDNCSCLGRYWPHQSSSHQHRKKHPIWLRCQQHPQKMFSSWYICWPIGWPIAQLEGSEISPALMTLMTAFLWNWCTQKRSRQLVFYKGTILSRHHWIWKLTDPVA